MDIGLVGLIMTAVLFWTGLLIGAVKWLLDRWLDRYLGHIDRRFEQLEQARDRETEKWQQLERRLAEEYVRREDQIRFSTVIDAKIDRLHEMVRGMNESLCGYGRVRPATRKDLEAHTAIGLVRMEE